MTSPQEGQILELNGISLYVEDHGDGVPVLHGWPDSARLWRHQVPFLVAALSSDLDLLAEDERTPRVSP